MILTILKKGTIERQPATVCMIPVSYHTGIIVPPHHHTSYFFFVQDAGGIFSAMEFLDILDMEKFTSILCLFVLFDFLPQTVELDAVDFMRCVVGLVVVVKRHPHCLR